MNFLRNLIQGSSSAAKTDSAKKKGPAAAGGLGGPPLDSEGQREAVITQENTGGSSPPLSPASTHSEASLPGLSPDGDAAFNGDDASTSTPCVTCVSELPGSQSEAPHTQGKAGHSEASANSDSEYESAEELDSAPFDSAPSQSEEAVQVLSTPSSPEAERAIREELVESPHSPHTPLECYSDHQTDTSFASSVNFQSAKTDTNTDVTLLNGAETYTTESYPETAPNAALESVANTIVTSLESEQSVSTVCESVVTLTKNEIAEESFVENTVLVDQQVVSATHIIHSSSLETDKPVDVSEINLDLITSGDNNNAGDCDPFTCVSVALNETKETSDQGYCGESEHVLEAHVVGEIADDPSVSEGTRKPEDTLKPSEEESTLIPRQETENRVQEKYEVSQDATETPDYLITDPYNTTEESNTGSSTATDYREETNTGSSTATDYREETITGSSTATEYWEETNTGSSTATEYREETNTGSSTATEYWEETNTGSSTATEYKEETNTGSSTATEYREETNTASSTTEYREESPPLIPPPDPDDIPIPPRKAYNLDFLDNLDDPNYNPFASKVAIRNSPPPSPEPGCTLPPLKPAVKRKSKKGVQVSSNHVESGSDGRLEDAKVDVDAQGGEKTSESSLSSESNSVDSKEQKETTDIKGLEISLDECDAPTNAPVKPLRKPPQRKPFRKTTPKSHVTEKNNNLVEKENENKVNQEEEDLPIPPSKGYNLDFLDNLDDPNFNPFTGKTEVRNSPPSSESALPVSQSPPEKLKQPKAKVVVPKKPSPKKGFAVPEKNCEVNRYSPQPSEDSVPQPGKNQESLQVSETCKSEPSHTEANHIEADEEEIPIPKQGYNLDFLDDPNFDPFQSRSFVDKFESGAKAAVVKDEEIAVISDISANDVVSNDKLETVVNKADVVSEKTVPKHPDSLPISEIEPSEYCVDKDVAEPNSEEVDTNTPEHQEHSEPIDDPKNQLDETPESSITKDIPSNHQTSNQNQDYPSLPDSENNWNTQSPEESTESGLGENKTPSTSTTSQLDSLEFDQLLEHEASRLAEEFMNCSRDSGLPDYESPDNHYTTMADTSYNIRQVDENVNPFQKGSHRGNSPPLGKRGAVCGAESTDSLRLPFLVRRSLKRDIVMGEERLDTSSFEDDSGIVIGSRSDLETEVNHSEAGPEIATGMTPSDLRCASQSNSDDLEEEFNDRITDEEFLSSETFFRDATELDNNLRRNLMSPLHGSHSRTTSGDVTPIKDKKEPPAGVPESPQNKVQELLKKQELKFEEKLLRVELAAGEKEKKLQQTMKDEQKDMATLGSSVSELTQSRDALLKMVSQYKGMLATLVTEKEKEKKAGDERISSLQRERDQALEDLANVEVAFSDVHRKYERTKQVVDTLRRNEETLRGAVSDYEAKMKKQELKFLEFQKHAEEKIQMANEEFEGMRRSNEQEMTKMAALLKKAEMKIMSLQDSFDRKTRENQELTQLCDDLINKVGTSH